jgi:hypothetical protein
VFLCLGFQQTIPAFFAVRLPHDPHSELASADGLLESVRFGTAPNENTPGFAIVGPIRFHAAEALGLELRVGCPLGSHPNVVTQKATRACPVGEWSTVGNGFAALTTREEEFRLESRNVGRRLPMAAEQHGLEACSVRKHCSRERHKLNPSDRWQMDLASNTTGWIPTDIERLLYRRMF